MGMNVGSTDEAMSLRAGEMSAETRVQAAQSGGLIKCRHHVGPYRRPESKMFPHIRTSVSIAQAHSHVLYVSPSKPTNFQPRVRSFVPQWTAVLVFEGDPARLKRLDINDDI